MAKKKKVDYAQKLEDAIFEYMLMFDKGFPRYQYGYLEDKELYEWITECLEKKTTIEKLKPIVMEDDVIY